MNMEKLIDTEGVSEWLGIKQSTIRMWVFDSKIPVVRVKSLVRFRPSDIEEWIKTGCQKPREEEQSICEI